MFAAAVLATSVPIVVAGARRVIGRWQPAGDDAAVTRLTYDVFTRHTPLLGMPSTLGAGGRPWPHHPGPMQFWALAVPLRLLASAPVGLMVGVGLVNIAAVIGVAAFVRRQAGTTTMLLALALLASAFFSIGQGALSSVLNPEIAILPLALFFVLAWSMAIGDTLALPFAALVGSFVVQAYLLYAPLVGALTVIGLARLVTTRGPHRDGSERERSSFRHRLVATAVVLGVCWSTAIYQVLTKVPGGGNVTAILHSSSRDSQAPIGFRRALSVVARSFTLVPLWDRGAFSRRYDELFTSPSLLTAAVAALVVGGLAVALVRSWRRDVVVRSLVLTALMTLAVTALTVSRTPRLSINPLLRVRYVWMIGAFAWFALGVAVVRLRLIHFRPLTSRALAGGLAAVVIVGAVLASTASKGAYNSDADASLAVRSLSRQLRNNIPRDQTYVVQTVDPVVGFGVMWDLVRHGYDIREPVTDPYYGPTHSPPLHKAVAVLYVVGRVTPFAHPPGSKVVASYGGTHQDAAERALQGLCRDLTDHPPAVTSLGRSLVGTLPQQVRQTILHLDAGSLPPCTPALVPMLRALLGYGLVTSPGITSADLAAVQTLFDDVASAAHDVILSPHDSSFEG